MWETKKYISRGVHFQSDLVVARSNIFADLIQVSLMTWWLF